MSFNLTDLAPLSDADFHRVRDMAYSACGIDLREGKRVLVSSRLERLVRRNGFDSFAAYIAFLSQRKHGSEFVEFIDTLTTNHSGFWREPEHFVFLQNEVLPRHRTRLRVWSAPCATGEEPYTIAMCALDAGVTSCRIAASDISHNALEGAVQGVYGTSKLACLPAGWVDRYFSAAPHPGTHGVIRAIREIVDFGQLNLLAPFAQMGSFDVIFCRNMMIYFDQRTRDDLVERLTRQLPPGGYLFTGHSETLLRLPPDLKYVKPATYRKS